MKTEETKEKTWQRTKIRGLLRHKRGRYFGRFTLGGKTEFVPMETDLLEIARTRFSEHKANVERLRKSARATKGGSGKMADLLALYIERVRARQGISESTRSRYLESAAYITKTWPEFATLRPDEVTRAAVEKWRDYALKHGTCYRPPGSKVEISKHSGRSPASFNKSIDALRAMLNFAVERGALHSNPLQVRGVKSKYRPHKPKLPDASVLRSIFQEIEKGSGVAGRGLEVADFCRFLAFTGCRLREAAKITWNDVDFPRGVIRVNGTKTEGSRREVPMIPAALDLLSQIFERRRKSTSTAINGEPFVDPSAGVLGVSEAGKSLTRACAELKAEKLTHHDLRDAFATQAIEAGVDVPTVASWLGHVDGGALLMKTYSHHRRTHSITQAAKVKF